jgi:hypothetical protein
MGTELLVVDFEESRLLRAICLATTMWLKRRRLSKWNSFDSFKRPSNLIPGTGLLSISNNDLLQCLDMLKENEQCNWHDEDAL